MQSVLTTNNLNIETTVITNPKLDNKNKRLSAGIINTETKSAIYFETPYLITPFGVSFFDGGKNIAEDQKSYSIVLKATGGQNENQEVINKFFDYFRNLDKKAVDYAITHSQTLFKKKYSEEQRNIVEDMLYNKCVKGSVSADGTVYPDKITLKIMRKEDGSPDLLVFKDSPTPLEIGTFENLQNQIPKGMAIKVIGKVKFYCVNGKIGINFQAIQVKLPNFEKVGRPVTYAFADSATTVSVTDNVLQKAVSVASVIVKEEESAEDSEEESEVEVEEN